MMDTVKEVRETLDILKKRPVATSALIVAVVLLTLAGSYLAAVVAEKGRQRALPQYDVVPENPILNPVDTLWLLSVGPDSPPSEPLTVEFDGVPFYKTAYRDKSTTDLRWFFTFKDKGIPAEQLQDGPHRISIAFHEKHASRPDFNICLSSHSPHVQTLLTKAPDPDSSFTLLGVARPATRLPSDTITVDLTFFHQGNTQRVAVPVTKGVTTAGQAYYEFTYAIQEPPHLLDTDDLYNDPFFRFEVSDRAGNTVEQTQSYAQFMAAGTHSFASGVADVTLTKGPSESGHLATTFTVIPRSIRPRPSTDRAVAEQELTLIVTGWAKSRTLTWSGDDETVDTLRRITVVMRDDQELGVSFGGRFVDDDFLREGQEVAYRVETIDHAGRRQASGLATFQTKVDLAASSVIHISSVVAAFDKGSMADYGLGVRITWETSIPSASQVIWAPLGTSDSTTISYPDLVSSHSVLLEDIRNDVSYSFHVVSTAPGYEAARSEENVFRFDVVPPGRVTDLRIVND